MITNTTVCSSCTWRFKAAHKSYSRRGYLKRFRYLLQHSDWNALILCYEGCLNKLCLGVIAAAFIYLLPLMLSAFMK